MVVGRAAALRSAGGAVDAGTAAGITAGIALIAGVAAVIAIVAAAARQGEHHGAGQQHADPLFHCIPPKTYCLEAGTKLCFVYKAEKGVRLFDLPHFSKNT